MVERRPELGGHADLYLEGSDQHRGWFHSALLTGVALARARAVRHGADARLRASTATGARCPSRSATSVAPDEVIKKHGAEILRLWVAAEDYRDDIRISDGDPRAARRGVPPHPQHGALPPRQPRTTSTRRATPCRSTDLPELDRWALDRAAALADRVRAAYEAYEFHVVYHALNNFCSVELSSALPRRPQGPPLLRARRRTGAPRHADRARTASSTSWCG